jgi:hypothetical protein
MSVDEQELIKWRLEVIAKESADTAIGAAAAQNLAAWQAEAAQQQAAPSTAASSEQPAPQASVAEAPAVQPQPEPAMPAPPPIKPVEAKIEQIEPAENKPVEPQPAPAPSQPTVLSPNAYRRRTRVLTPEERNALTKTHLTSRPKPKDDTPETMTKPSLCSCIRSSWIGSESLRFDPMRDYDRWDTQGRPCIASGVACPRNQIRSRKPFPINHHQPSPEKSGLFF